MIVSRREFGAGLIAGAVTSLSATPSFAQPVPVPPPLGAALAAIRTYGGHHLAHFGFPGMTLGLTTPSGFSTVLNFGFAKLAPARTIAPDTLFQVGSITKAMTALVVHQLAGEGRFRLADRVAGLLPQVPLPAGSQVTVQDLLDHVGGIPADAPVSPPGGLWTGYPSGAHWHYSNTGYEILGLLVEHAGGAPLAELLQRRIFAPAAMSASRGAILERDRDRYAQGYRAADQAAPFAVGAPLEAAPWVDATSGAICVGSTAADMIRFLRALAEVARGRGGLGLGPSAGLGFASRQVPSDTPGLSYGNGLMHVEDSGRPCLHHTGGMVSFSSSFHLDVESGAGAFACANISAFAEYRPRSVTSFAVAALSAALAGRPLPLPPALTFGLPNAASYLGSYRGPSGGFEVVGGAPLTIRANGRSAPLQPWTGELFRTNHPDFHAFTLMFERRGAAVVGASWGRDRFAHSPMAPPLASPDLALAAVTGRYSNPSPWWGAITVVQRGGQLWIGTETPLFRVADDLWRIGPEPWTPERVQFVDIEGGRPGGLLLSGVPFTRADG